MYSIKFSCIAATTAMLFISTIVQAEQTCKDSAGKSPCEGTNSPCACMACAEMPSA